MHHSHICSRLPHLRMHCTWNAAGHCSLSAQQDLHSYTHTPPTHAPHLHIRHSYLTPLLQKTRKNFAGSENSLPTLTEEKEPLLHSFISAADHETSQLRLGSLPVLSPGCPFCSRPAPPVSQQVSATHTFQGHTCLEATAKIIDLQSMCDDICCTQLMHFHWCVRTCVYALWSFKLVKGKRVYHNITPLCRTVPSKWKAAVICPPSSNLVKGCFFSFFPVGAQLMESVRYLSSVF